MTRKDRLARVEAFSVRYPKLYKAAVGLVAITADAVWRGTTILPLTFGLVLGALWIDTPWIWVAVGLVSLLLAWSLTPYAALPGRPLSATDAPTLFAELASLSTQLGSPNVDEVRLTDDLNAGASRLRSWRNPLRGKQVLFLGVPLLATLPADEARAVVAHELGHFSKMHGLVGHWLYRARLGWLALLENSHETDNLIDRLARQFARVFVPWFEPLSYIHARQCEFEADALATKAEAPKALIAALLRIHLLERNLNERIHAASGPLQIQYREPPSHWWSQLQSDLTQLTWSDRDRDEAWSERHSELDTHPSLADRAAAVGVTRTLLPRSFESSLCAGSIWLAGSWTSTLAEADRSWRDQRARSWTGTHFGLKYAESRVANLVSSSGRTKDESTELVMRLTQLGRTDQAKQYLHAHELVAEDDPFAAWSLGELTLATAASPLEDVNLDALESTISKGRHWAFPMRDLLLRLDSTTNDESAMKRHSTLKERAQLRRREAFERAQAQIDQAALELPATLSSTWPVLVEMCEAEDLLLQAWLGHCRIALSPTLAFDTHVLVIQLDHQRMLSHKIDEDDVAEAFSTFLRTVRPNPTDLVVVRSCYATETTLPAALDKLGVLHWRRG